MLEVTSIIYGFHEINPFLANVPILYPRKTFWFSAFLESIKWKYWPQMG